MHCSFVQQMCARQGYVFLMQGVVQEQAKTKSLELALKDKEVALRAAAEETDALQFNNDRLTKRIEKMLQHAKEVCKAPTPLPEFVLSFDLDLFWFGCEIELTICFSYALLPRNSLSCFEK